MHRVSSENSRDGRHNRRIRLEVKIKSRLREGVERLLEAGEGLSMPQVDPTELREIELIDAHGHSGCARQIGIMAEDRHPVGRRMHVGLEVGDADRKGREKSEKSVFRRIRCQASVCKDAGQRAKKEPVAGTDRAWFSHAIFRLASVVISRAPG
jgi:hypothetical protein